MSRGIFWICVGIALIYCISIGFPCVHHTLLNCQELFSPDRSMEQKLSDIMMTLMSIDFIWGDEWEVRRNETAFANMHALHDHISTLDHPKIARIAGKFNELLKQGRIVVNPTLTGVAGCWIDTIGLLYLREDIGSYSISEDFRILPAVLDTYASILVHEIEHSLQDEGMEHFEREERAYFCESTFFCLRTRQMLEDLSIHSDLVQWGQVNAMINRAIITINSFVETMQSEENREYITNRSDSIVSHLKTIWSLIDQWIRDYPLWIQKDDVQKESELGLFVQRLQKILGTVLAKTRGEEDCLSIGDHGIGEMPYHG
ncbi:MAG: hypothetical protein ACMUJM_04005 [bacterium]